MHSLRAGRYLAAYILPLLVLLGLSQGGIWTFAPLLYIYGVLPLLELLLPAPVSNLTEPEEESVESDPLYDVLLYLAVPVQYGLLGYFFFVLPDLHGLSLVGAIISLGLMCGTFGINVAHELGHRPKQLPQFAAKLLLLSSLNTHFFVEHNRGHHRRVATIEDPASARRGETLYHFWMRSIYTGYRSAWQLENTRLAKQERHWFSFQNQMFRWQLMQLVAVAMIFGFLGVKAGICFLIAATGGILLLETVNYIEHYGLQRVKQGARYERVSPIHSWNSNHILGRLTLFELSRHSDHHARASRPYPILRHHEASPQMPTGYPGMMLVALIPPVWFHVMHRQIARFQAAES
ncbi:alkane 1-monooxygenase [Microbulbifer agarilyticus]|uniref:alkane 1-monooxygenase n=1 Tax=Microbulbifer agarilyticus TaxID=260552 RepID=UPI001CD4A764|nr:alkane 1-monooxygenase [Microbulbifer agarilyticus]MCA0901362.1 alkane 1-monooxygenase [Microbulbifer agarilyticus]